jgi:uncharacterized membrane protein
LGIPLAGRQSVGDRFRGEPIMNERVHRIAELLLGSHVDLLHERHRRVVSHVAEQRSISRDVNATYDSQLTVGERMADLVARFGGSWTFISLFGAFLLTWAVLNSLLLHSSAFDPYPYIFLNLLLSMLAAIQAPIIMMSQNRQAAKDRVAAEHDYEINLKAEIEICQLHDKIEELRSQHIAQLLELQQQQVDLLRQIAASAGRSEAAAGSPPA